MADAYPLDQAERRDVDQFLDELSRERADATRDNVTTSAQQRVPSYEARENVIDALRGILELRFGEHALAEAARDSESLELRLLSAV